MTDLMLRLWFDSQLSDIMLGRPDPLTGVPTTTPMQVNGVAVEPMTEVAWRSSQFDSVDFPPTRAWFRPTFTPFTPSPDAVGTAARNKVSGIYQVDMFGPIEGDDTTEAQMIRILEPIQKAFCRGIQYSTPDLCLTCMQSWVSNSERDKDTARWMVSIRVRWTATLAN